MYDQGPAVGTVKFDTTDKSAAVYIEGGFAGTVGDLKNLLLQRGTYNIELRPPIVPPTPRRSMWEPARRYT